tara:strand:- start:433 stop:714 length:282 start_codon:yes stop_codon:yes gene_type:complete
MHTTTTTKISDTITQLRKLEDKLRHASFIPSDELLGLLIAGSLVIETISGTDKNMFTEDEVELVVNLSYMIEDEMNHIDIETGDAFEGDEYDG